MGLGLVLMRLPSRVQLGTYGGASAASSTGALGTGRPAPPRPEILLKGEVQARERFIASENMSSDVARALNDLQRKIDDSTSPSRANPFVSGRLFQNVTVSGPKASGPSSGVPNTNGLALGFMYWDTTLNKPAFLQGPNWVDGAGTVLYAATVGTATFTVLNHGLASAPTGFLITAVNNGELRATPRFVPFGTSADNTQIRLFLPYIQWGTAPVQVDVYVFT